MDYHYGETSMVLLVFMNNSYDWSAHFTSQKRGQR